MIHGCFIELFISLPLKLEGLIETISTTVWIKVIQKLETAIILNSHLAETNSI